MDTTNPPPTVVVQQKSGMGCFGIGCIVCLVALLLIAALATGIGYLLYSKVGALTSATPVATQTFDGGEAMYKSASDKVSVFQQAVRENKPASLELTADEINTLIARNPDMAGKPFHAFVTMTGDRMHLELSASTDVIPGGWFKDRFFNGEVDLSPSFDPASKTLSVMLHRLRLGNQDIPSNQLSTFQSQINPAINAKIQQSSDVRDSLNRIQTIEVRDGKLEIQTR